MVGFAESQKQFLFKLWMMVGEKRKVISTESSFISPASLVLVSIQSPALLLLRVPVLCSQDYCGKQQVRGLFLKAANKRKKKNPKHKQPDVK